jgi:hypothetical protein
LRERYVVTVLGIAVIRRLRMVVFKDHGMIYCSLGRLRLCSIVVVGVGVILHERGHVVIFVLVVFLISI